MANWGTQLTFNHLGSKLLFLLLCIIVALVSFSSNRSTPSTMHGQIEQQEHRHPPGHADNDTPHDQEEIVHVPGIMTSQEEIDETIFEI